MRGSEISAILCENRREAAALFSVILCTYRLIRKVIFQKCLRLLHLQLRPTLLTPSRNSEAEFTEILETHFLKYYLCIPTTIAIAPRHTEPLIDLFPAVIGIGRT